MTGERAEAADGDVGGRRRGAFVDVGVRRARMSANYQRHTISVATGGQGVLLDIKRSCQYKRRGFEGGG